MKTKEVEEKCLLLKETYQEKNRKKNLAYLLHFLKSYSVLYLFFVLGQGVQHLPITK